MRVWHILQFFTVLCGRNERRTIKKTRQVKGGVKTLPGLLRRHIGCRAQSAFQHTTNKTLEERNVTSFGCFFSEFCRILLL